MEQLIIGVFEQGFIYAIMALGVYITYKIFTSPDYFSGALILSNVCFACFCTSLLIVMLIFLAAAVLMMTSPLLNVSNFISFAFFSPFKILAANGSRQFTEESRLHHKLNRQFSSQQHADIPSESKQIKYSSFRI